MTRMPRLTGDRVIQCLRRVGFEIARRRGSHVMLKHYDGRSTVVPVHSGETVGAGLMSKIQNDLGVDRKTFIRLLTATTRAP